MVTGKFHEKTPASQEAVSTPGPDMMLGLWTSWIESASESPFAAVVLGERAPGAFPWQMSADGIAGDLLQGSVRQLGEMLAKDPFLRAAEEALNANPLREVVPVDWAEIARALRTVWLRSLSRPKKPWPRPSSSIRGCGNRQWQPGTRQASAGGTWRRPTRRTNRLAAPTSGLPRPNGNRNPAYRTLKEMYLLASDWLLRQTDRRG